MPTRTKTKPVPVQPYVSPQTARLHEVTGHYGPWTSSEFNEAFPPLAPSREPEPAPPAEVVELAEARDLAASAFERIDAKWQDAALEERRAQDGGPIRVSKIGDLLTDPNGPRRLRKAREVLKSLTEERDLAAADLRRASSKWRKAETAWRHQLLADEYDAKSQ